MDDKLRNHTDQHKWKDSSITYKLDDIYKKLYNYAPNTKHEAEADAINLMKCAITIKKQFVELADVMTKKFNSFK